MCTGADTDIEEAGGVGGGGGTHRVGIGAARVGRQSVRALASFPGLRAFVTCSMSLKSLRTRPRIYSMYSLVWGSGGILPQENFEI